MPKFTLELPDTITVPMRNGASVTANTSELSNVFAELFIYGVNQKLRDSASAATKAAEAEGSLGVQAEAQAMMDAALASLVAGEWSHRGDGTGVDERTRVARSVVRSAIKAKYGAKSPEWAKLTGLSDADQLAKLDETYAAQPAVFDEAIDAEMAERARKAKAKAKLGKALSVDL